MRMEPIDIAEPLMHFVPRRPFRPSVIALVLVAGLGLQRAEAQTGPTVTPGASRAYSTIYSIGLEWEIAGDADHDAAATVMYRAAGATTWAAALPLVRVDYNGSNMLAGSILFLTPATRYEVSVALSDPDGGAEMRTLTVTTRPLPALSAGGRTFHVVPGAGGGDGTSTAPFRGVAAAAAVAQPGDTFLLHGGNYGGRIRFDRPGTASSYVVWKAAGDGEALFYGIDIAASHVWLEGLTVRDMTYAAMSVDAPSNVVLTRSRFYNNHYSIYLQGGGEGWYIADNTIVGNTFYTTESFSGEGVELNVTSGHTVAHNSISNVADGISYPLRNVDIFGNDIFDTSDDGIEPDFGYGNIRIWGNRIHNAVHNGISFQPQNSAPWYIIRNQIVSNAEAAFKFRTTDRFVLLHNTIVNWGVADPMMCCNVGQLLRGIARNNLWIAVHGGQMWGFGAALADWRTDLDFDGFDYGTVSNPFAYGGTTYPDLGTFSAASGLERNGLVISKEACFETFNVPSPPINPVPPQTMTLKAGCSAIDAGEMLPNVNDRQFSGAAPDLGAYEYGRPAPAYGPRLNLVSAPFGGTARSLPGTVQAEDFDEGGEGVAYHDVSAGNSGTVYRATDVDIQATTDAGGGYNVGWVAPGEWLVYSVTVPTAGNYQLDLRVAASGSGGRLHVEFDGVDRTGPMTIPNTGGWQQWTTVSAPVTLAAGPQRMRVVIDAATNGVVGNLNYFRVVAATPPNAAPTVTLTQPSSGATFVAPATISMAATASDSDGTIARVNFYSGATLLGSDTTAPYAFTWSDVAAASYSLSAVAIDDDGATSQPSAVAVTVSSSTAYTGTAVSLPGVVQAENFDTGAAQVAYRDLSAGNIGGSYRATDVDIEATSDIGGGYNVGWMAAGEWLAYSVTVPAAGSYRLDLRVASNGAGGQMHVEFGGVDKTGAMTIPNTGGWQTWTTLSAAVTLSAGGQRMRVIVDAASASGVVGNLNYVQVVAASPLPPRDIVTYASDITTAALHGSWSKVSDSTSPNGVKLVTPNNGVAVTSNPLSSPTHFVDVTFNPVAGTPYTVWLRLKALGDSKWNDAIWIQFSGAHANGAQVYPLNTTSGLLVNLATGSTGSSLRNWGWHNGAYWLSQPTRLTFPAGGTQTLRIQVREDGVQFDQIVLSPSTYLVTAPGGPTDDTTIVPKP